jgi:hypothetical protein
MDIIIALALVLGIPTVAALFIAREAELYKERERNRRD